jgi:pyruvate formate lyase activating enzyme
MLLSGLQKNSLIDYPGKISCVLFVSGCNFDCPYCHNPSLVKGGSPRKSFLDEKEVCDFLEKRRGFLDGVVISGGEPTLQEELLSFCEKVKGMGYSIKLDTNGSRPPTIKRLIAEGVVDYFAMDIKTDIFHYAPLVKNNVDPTEDILSSIQIIMEYASAYEFRTTCVKPIVDAHIIKNISKTIKGAMLYALQRFYDTEVLRPEFFHETDAGYDEDELLHLKSIAEPWVDQCVVR